MTWQYQQRRKIRNHLISAALLALTPLLAAPVHAALIRSGGGTVQQDSFNETVMVYEEATLDYRASRIVSGTSIDSYSRNSLNPPAFATPPEDCWYNTFSEIEGAPLIRTACHYEFYVGDMLELMGAARYPLDGVDYLLSWTIFGMGQTWQFDSDSLSHTHFQTAMPDDMGPGEYWVSFTFTQIAQEGYALFRYSNILDPYRCDEAENREGTGPEIVCGQTGSLTDSIMYTDAARLYVLERPTAVPTPASWLLLSAGLLALARLRRR
ncbi:MAG TPA: hypothetical protein VFV64_01190 [Permianibacter sp.]|nr:hypothetical protein [Permianibacter sp.]